jgi:hypothetical protein
VEPTLRGGAAVRPEDRLEGERGRARERMHLNPHAVVDPVELDRPARRRLDDLRVALNGSLDAADVLETIERPEHVARCGLSNHADH